MPPPQAPKKRGERNQNQRQRKHRRQRGQPQPQNPQQQAAQLVQMMQQMQGMPGNGMRPSSRNQNMNQNPKNPELLLQMMSLLGMDRQMPDVMATLQLLGQLQDLSQMVRPPPETHPMMGQPQMQMPPQSPHAPYANAAVNFHSVLTSMDASNPMDAPESPSQNAGAPEEEQVTPIAQTGFRHPSTPNQFAGAADSMGVIPDVKMGQYQQQQQQRQQQDGWFQHQMPSTPSLINYAQASPTSAGLPPVNLGNMPMSPASNYAGMNMFQNQNLTSPVHLMQQQNLVNQFQYPIPQSPHYQQLNLQQPMAMAQAPVYQQMQGQFQ